MKLPKDSYEFDGTTDEEWEAFTRQQRLDEDALLAVDVDSLSEAQAKDALRWALMELDGISAWSRNTIQRARAADTSWTGEGVFGLPGETDTDGYTGTTGDVVSSLARLVYADYASETTRTDNVAKANSERAMRPDWLKAALTTAYDKYHAEKGKPPGRTHLESYAIKAARAAGVSHDALGTISESRLRNYLKHRKRHP